VAAVEHAHSILNWQENLPDKDVPPQWMWHLDHELELWFDALKTSRGSSGDTSDDGEAPMMRNALVKGRR
jgi:hypothetical protein